MARDEPQMKIRLPEELRERIVDASEANRRSLNAEIVARLEASFESPSAPSVPNLDHITDETEKAIRRAVATSLFHVTKTMAAIVEAGKEAEDAGQTANYVEMVRQIADDVRDTYRLEVEAPEIAGERLRDYMRHTREGQK